MKNKKEIYFFAQATHKEDKLEEFSWRFECYNQRVLECLKEDPASRFCEEIIFTPKDLFVVFLIYCALKFSINLRV